MISLPAEWKPIIDWLLAQWDLKVIAVLIFLDLLTAIAVALHSRTFDARRLADFLGRLVLPYLIVYVGFKVTMWALGDPWQAAVYAALGAIVLALYTSIKDNLKELGLNIPLPDLRLTPTGEEDV
jgi:membrane associated rhomboid family serine protease